MPCAYSTSRSARAHFEGHDRGASQARVDEADGLRVRLELAERARSTLEDERRLVLEELVGERPRREEAEQERDELRCHLGTTQQPPTSSAEAPEEGLQPGGDRQGVSWRAPWWPVALLVVVLLASVSFLAFFVVSLGIVLGGGALGA